MKQLHLARRAFAALLVASTLAGTSLALAQSKIVHLVVAFPPGGPVDFVARVLSEQLGKELGQQVMVDNRAGANGAIAAEYVSRAAPDSYTYWLTSVGAVAINPSLYEKLSYDPQRDLKPVSLIVNNVEILVVVANAPYNTGAEFVAASRRQKDPLTMASTGTGSVPHLAMELLNESAKIKLMHVPYKGAAPAITDLLGGSVNGFFGDIPGLIPFINSGKLKAIAIAAPKRHPLFPNVKTFAEMGMPGVDSDNWYALFASKGASDAEVDRMNQAVRKALANESVKARLQASGAEPAPSTPAELTTLLKNDSAKWARIVRANNIKSD